MTEAECPLGPGDHTWEDHDERIRALEAERTALTIAVEREKARAEAAERHLGEILSPGVSPSPLCHCNAVDCPCDRRSAILAWKVAQCTEAAEKAEAKLAETHEWFHIELKPRNKPDPWCWFCAHGEARRAQEAK